MFFPSPTFVSNEFFSQEFKTAAKIHNMRILIVDDHPVLRKGMFDLIKVHHPDWEIHEAENGVQAILLAADVKPDLILMDYIMPKLDGMRAASTITRDMPGSKIIMVTMSDREELLMSSIEAGVRCIIPKDAPVDVILETISDITNGTAGNKPVLSGDTIRRNKKGNKGEKNFEQQSSNGGGYRRCHKKKTKR